MKSKIMNFGGLEYEVFEDGKIIGCVSGKEIKQRLDIDGYPTFTYGSYKERKSMRVHRAMALTFLEKPEDADEIAYDVDHIDDNRQNNHISNLQYLTHVENVKKAYRNGGHDGKRAGELNGRATFTEDEVRKIRSMYDSGVKIMDIIKDFHPDFTYRQRKNIWSTFNHICKRNTWKNIK